MNYNLFSKAAEHAIAAHKNTNHYYDEYLPYEFHLRMVVHNAEKFIYLVPKEGQQEVIDACWLHDVIEDARENYNSVKEISNACTAEIVRACTNYTRGRNRKERMPDEVYRDIREVPFATFVKLCDRIANVQYSKMTGSKMFEMYKKEHTNFLEKLHKEEELDDMWNYLHEIFDSKN